MKPNHLPKLHALAKPFARRGEDVHTLLHETAIREGIIESSLREIAQDWTACSQLLRKIKEQSAKRALPQTAAEGDYLRSQEDIRRYIIDHLIETESWAHMSMDLCERIIRVLDVLREKYTTRALKRDKADWLMERMKRRGGKAIKTDDLKEALDIYLDRYLFDREKREEYLVGIIRNVTRRKGQGEDQGRDFRWYYQPSSQKSH
jgi:hypothetical protein